MRFLIPLAAVLAIVCLLCQPFAPAAVPNHDADAAIALALATFRPCEVQANSPQEPVCKCGCAEGFRDCTCGLKCPDILRMPKQMPGGWHSDYGAAKTESERTGKPMLVDLRQPECVYCDALDRELGAMDLSPFVCVRLDRQSAVGVAMQARVAPTLIVAAPDGTVTSRSDGYAPPETIRWHLSSAFRPVAQAVTHPVQTFGRVVTMPVRVMGGACRSGH